jgi:hypothetical protein
MEYQEQMKEFLTNRSRLVSRLINRALKHGIKIEVMHDSREIPCYLIGGIRMPLTPTLVEYSYTKKQVLAKVRIAKVKALAFTIRKLKADNYDWEKILVDATKAANVNY